MVNDKKEELKQLIKQVEDTFSYLKPNFERFHKFRKFVYQSNLTEIDRAVLRAQGKPDVEFNISEQEISKLLGEFAKQQPSVSVSSQIGKKVNPEIIQAVEDHARYIIFEANKNGCEYECYKDTLSGGFSWMKVSLEYLNEMSSHQKICISRVFDPTLCGYDRMAVTPTKMDGNFVFQMYPMSIEHFKTEYPKVYIEKSRNQAIGGFSWTYTAGLNDVVMLCEMYCKKRKKVQVVTLLDGQTMLYSEYKQAKQEYEADLTNLEQFPAFVGKPRWTTKTTIWRYLFTNTDIIECDETIFKEFPLVYIPGNDMLIRDDVNGSVQLMTRPYVLNLYGAQRLKNYAGQCWANELENMVQHKFMVANETLPEQSDYLEAWLDPQKPSTLVYNAYSLDKPNKQLPLPQPVPRVPMPPEIAGAFTAMDQLSQVILGSFNPQNMNQQNLSGDSIVEASIQSNFTAMPYIVGYLQAWSHVLQVCVSVMPKIYMFPREIPVNSIDNRQKTLKINQPDGLSFKYNDDDLEVKVEAGVNFNVQKNRALSQIIALMKVSPVFAQFINQEGLDILLDNIEIRGIDALKQKVDEFAEKMKQQQAQAMQNNPEMKKLELKAKELELNSHHEMIDDQLAATKLSLQKEELDIKKMQAEADVGMKQSELDAKLEKVDAERSRSQVDLAVKLIDVQHKTRQQAHEHAEKIAKHTLEKQKHYQSVKKENDAKNILDDGINNDKENEIEREENNGM